MVGSFRRLLPVPFRLQNQLLQGAVDGFGAGGAGPLVPDHSLMIDDVERRRGGRLPLVTDRPRVRKRSPGQLLRFYRLLELLDVVAIDVDADQGEGLLCQLLDERPLVGPLGPSGDSLLMPEVEKHHLAPVVAQLEALAILVLALDVGCDPPDCEAAEPE